MESAEASVQEGEEKRVLVTREEEEEEEEEESQEVKLPQVERESQGRGVQAPERGRSGPVSESPSLEWQSLKSSVGRPAALGGP